MKNNKQLFTGILLLSALALLTGCGTSKNNEAGVSDFSSRVPIADTNTTKQIASCSSGNGTNINMKMKAFTDTNNTPRMDFVFVRLTALPTNFKEGKNYISMWKWLANSSGNTYLDTTALQFFLVDSSDNKTLTGWKSTLSWSDVATIASGMGITEVQTFFDRVNILVDLKDTKGEYDVLKITNYDSATNKPVSQVDGLLPLYYVNPIDYATETGGTPRPTVLKNLHPFAAMEGYTSEQLLSMSNDFCF